MNGGKFLAIKAKRHWTPEQWDIYHRMSWVGRMLADVMVLTPSLSRWLAERALVYDDRRKARQKTQQRNALIATSSRHISSASRPSLRSLREP
jgi:hypothetical protein